MTHTTDGRTMPADRERSGEVTSENFEALLLESARDAVAIARGITPPARRYTRERTGCEPGVVPVRTPTWEGGR